jgi:hypothetical protein
VRRRLGMRMGRFDVFSEKIFAAKMAKPFIFYGKNLDKFCPIFWTKLLLCNMNSEKYFRAKSFKIPIFYHCY